MPGHPESSSGSSGETDLIVRGKHVVTPDGERTATIHIHGGVIRKISGLEDVSPASLIYEAGDLAVMPGLVDTHVHINEPGRTEWEGFGTATRAAAAGGITTLIEMPLTAFRQQPASPHFRRNSPLQRANSQWTQDFGEELFPAMRRNCSTFGKRAASALSVS